MKLPKSPKTGRGPFRQGYTLVEMLVSVGLVMLIMILLAQVFSLATGSMEKHRATSANDQQARTFVSIIKGDLCARSFRFVYPFSSTKSFNASDVWAPGPDFDPEYRRGYFSVSENDRDDNTDDVLSFTIDLEPSVSTTCLHSDVTGLYGKAAMLGGTLQNTPNQPEFDDGFPYPNGLGIAKRAEVVYFLRNGNLYRRVMLLRDAYDDSHDTGGTGQPTNNSGGYLLNGPYTSGTGRFWNDFDYSAVFNSTAGQERPYFLNGSTSGSGFPSALENHNFDELIPFDFGGSPVTVPLSLGIPHFRFGHDINDPLGRPKEFIAGPDVTLADDDIFIGRFLAQENAHPDFGYPGANPDPYGTPSSNPHHRDDMDLDPATGLVQPFSSEIDRRGEEILLSNVFEFDVKVWDEGVRQFVDLGHNGSTAGHYHSTKNQNTAYGNIYDTWHPHSAIGEPPYRPASVGVNGVYGSINDDDGDGNPAVEPSWDPSEHNPEELGWLGTDDEVRLKAIRITIRFLDPQLKLVRQVTITEHLTD